MLNFCLLTPKRHILARNRVVWRITRENRFRCVGCSSLEEPKKKPSKHVDAQFRAYGEKKPLEGSPLNFACPWRNHVCNFLWRSVKGFGGGKGSNFPFSHWLASSPLQHSRTSVWQADSNSFATSTLEEKFGATSKMNENGSKWPGFLQTHTHWNSQLGSEPTALEAVGD